MSVQPADQPSDRPGDHGDQDGLDDDVDDRDENLYLTAHDEALPTWPERRRAATFRQHSALVSRLISARQRSLIAAVDYQRALREAGRELLQAEIATLLNISPQAVSASLRRAAKVELPVPGQTSTSPYELCQRCAAGLMDESELLRALLAWPHHQAEAVLGRLQDDDSPQKYYSEPPSPEALHAAARETARQAALVVEEATLRAAKERLVPQLVAAQITDAMAAAMDAPENSPQRMPPKRPTGTDRR
ncbi:MAG: hypothetical protein ACTIJJ_12195 [Galactobacter sp.]